MADDGSDAAANARSFALMLAAAAGARLTAVYVRDPLESRERGRRKLDGMLVAASTAGLRCKAVVEPPIGITNRGRRILAAGRRQRADLIVVGARGAGLVRKLLGSVSSYVVSHARVSVCVVR
jgi:nucleotide-binding universal stress UspA family protein